MPVPTSQAAFLENPKNKERFICGLSVKLCHTGLLVEQAHADADVLIVATALSAAADEKPVAVVGTDTDLLVMLAVRIAPTMNLYMCNKSLMIAYNIHDIRKE